MEVLDRIHRTLKDERGEDALTPHRLKQAAKERVFGFEILPAPYVIAHLQLGMFLQRANAPLTSTQERRRERAGVYLTNSLTGWEPPDKQKSRLPFQEFEQEREEADTVKRDKPILVILGNPPYNAFAGVSPAEEDSLVEPYKEGLVKEWSIKKFNLDDLYVRFFRLAERRIAEKSNRGVVCFISNMSWVREPSFVVLRRQLFNAFNKIWIENLHGNRKISEYAPDGRTSETVFAVAGFSPGIQQGVATTLWVKTGIRSQATVLFRGDLNEAKAEDRRKMLLASLDEKEFDSKYVGASPSPSNRYSFWPQQLNVAYGEWPKIIELCAEPPSNGLMEKRGGALVDIDRDKLEQRMRLYHDKRLDWDAYRLASSALTGDWAGFNAKKARARALDAGFCKNQIVRYAVRPFDNRWCYYTDIPSIWNRSRPPLWAQRFEGNSFLLTRMRCTASPEGFPVSFSKCLSDDHYIVPDAVAVPFFLRNLQPARKKKKAAPALGTNAEMFVSDSTDGNLSAIATDYLKTLNADATPENAEALWLHVLAISYSLTYLEENADAVRQDWPRIPLPASPDQFRASAALGKQVADLLDTEWHAPGVTAGALRHELRSVASLSRLDRMPLVANEDLKLTGGWGHAGKDGVTMPGRGKLVSRERTAKEHSELMQGLADLGIQEDEALVGLGRSVVDVYLNDYCAWKNVPEKVWELYIGGYQVMKKWLSYREHSFVKRPLTLAEAEELQAMARRLTALCLLQPELDANYLRVKSSSRRVEARHRSQLAN